MLHTELAVGRLNGIGGVGVSLNISSEQSVDSGRDVDETVPKVVDCVRVETGEVVVVVRLNNELGSSQSLVDSCVVWLGKLPESGLVVDKENCADGWLA